MKHDSVNITIYTVNVKSLTAYKRKGRVDPTPFIHNIPS